jgi:signal recognition particle GTPase
MHKFSGKKKRMYTLEPEDPAVQTQQAAGLSQSRKEMIESGKNYGKIINPSFKQSLQNTLTTFNSGEKGEEADLFTHETLGSITAEIQKVKRRIDKVHADQTYTFLVEGLDIHQGPFDLADLLRRLGQTESAGHFMDAIRMLPALQNKKLTETPSKSARIRDLKATALVTTLQALGQ